MLVIGSATLAMRGIFLREKSSDLDIICTKQEFKDIVKELSKTAQLVHFSIKDSINPEFGQHGVAKFKDEEGNIEIYDAFLVDGLDPNKVGNDLWLYNWSKINAYSMTILGVKYVSPEFVLMLKMSHRFRHNSAHFHKTRKDILSLRARGITLNDELQHIMEERQNLTLKKHPKLNVDKESFFTDDVPYKYDHDTIHEAIKIFEKPAYQFYIADGEQVQCSKEKWDMQLDCIKLAGVIEEASVLALERSIIPFDTDPQKAFEMALEKVCTSITSGWFREYAWENYGRVLKNFHPTILMDKFNEALSCGMIKPYKTT